MRLTVRLYPLYDMDLIPYKMDKSFRFASLVKNALKAYSKGEVYTLPDAPKVNWSDYNYSPFDCCIDFKDTPELEQLFDGMRKRYKSAFVKMILRQGCSNVDMNGFFNNVVVQKDYTHKNEGAKERRFSSVSEKKENSSKRDSFISNVKEREERELLEQKDKTETLLSDELNDKDTEKISSQDNSLSHKENLYEVTSEDDIYNPVELEDDDDMFDSFLEVMKH